MKIFYSKGSGAIIPAQNLRIATNKLFELLKDYYKRGVHVEYTLICDDINGVVTFSIPPYHTTRYILREMSMDRFGTIILSNYDLCDDSE